jgi:hypothetical protein
MTSVSFGSSSTAHGTMEHSMTHPGTAEVIRRFNDGFLTTIADRTSI